MSNRRPSGRNDAPSGTRPAENRPCPAPSGTSGTEIDTRLENSACPPSDSRILEARQGLLPESLPDVLNGAGRGLESAGQLPDEGAADPAGRDESEACNHSLTVRGVLHSGGMRTPRDSFDHLENPDLRGLLGREVEPDTVLEADDNVEFSVVDVDVHHWPTQPGVEALQAHLAAVEPAPDAAWVSHGGGLKLVFIGPHHADRALAAAFSLPSSFNVELLRHTRHPSSISSDHAGGRCGPVVFFDTAPHELYEFRNVGPLTHEAR